MLMTSFDPKITKKKLDTRCQFTLLKLRTFAL